MKQTKTIVDSHLSSCEAIIQNPNHLCSEEILQSLGLMEVEYLGFDNNKHRGQIVIATEVMSDVEAFFRNALEIGFPIAKVVPLSSPDYRWDSKKVLADNLTAGFDYRNIKGTNKLSLHSYGLAFDVNPRQNPYILYKANRKDTYPRNVKWNPKKPGTLHADHQLVKLMEGFGWEWGGHWTRKSGRTDYMHFQKRQLHQI